MTLMAILVAAALLSAAFMLWVARGRSSNLTRVEELQGRVRPVEIQAFRALMDPAETKFLRARLPHGEFRKIQRERLLAAAKYISCAAQNAAVLIRIGEAARRSPDRSIADAGEKLVNNAIHLRMLSAQALLMLYLEMILPSRHSSLGELAEVYERMTGLVFLLGRLQRRTVAVSAGIA